MEQFQFLRDKAKEKIKVADHMLFMTYPVVRDPKLLLAIVENVFAGLDYGMASLLHHDVHYKRIAPFKDSYQSRVEVFRNVVAQRNLNPNYVRLVNDVRGLLREHKKSPVTFVKRDKLVVCSPDYKVKTIDANLVKKYVFQSKIFVDHMSNLVNQNERIVLRS